MTVKKIFATTFLLTVAFATTLLVGNLIVACGSSTPTPSSPNPAAAACIVHRTADQLACADLYDTKVEIDACRAKVQARLDCTKLDGGTETTTSNLDSGKD